MDKIKLSNCPVNKTRLVTLIPTLSDSLRIGGTHKTSQLLIKFIDKLTIYTQTSDQALQSKLVVFIQEITEAHIRNDWLGLADIIQYNIQPLLKD